MQNIKKAKLNVTFIRFFFLIKTFSRLCFSHSTFGMCWLQCLSYLCIHQWLWVFLQVSKITKIRLVFLSATEGKGWLRCWKISFFSVNTSPAPKAAQSIQNQCVCSLWHPSDPAVADGSHAFLRMFILFS